MFMYNDGKQTKLSINDVLTTLKNTNDIAVLDVIPTNAPKAFIGPNGLAAPKGYTKFDLPYLSMIEHGQIGKKVEELPFFVAPLSYKALTGFSKIPLPSPHVGSVVVNSPSRIEPEAFPVPLFQKQTAHPHFFPQPALQQVSTTRKPLFDADHYTSPTPKPYYTPTVGTTERPYQSRGSTRGQTKFHDFEEIVDFTEEPTAARLQQTERALYTFSNANSLVSETKKAQPEKTIFKPLPPVESVPAFTAPELTAEAETEAPAVVEVSKPQFVYTQSPSSPSTATPAPSTANYDRFTSTRDYSSGETTRPRNPDVPHEHYIHKFKFVESVRPVATQPPARTTSRPSFNFDFFNTDFEDSLRSRRPTVTTTQRPETTVTTTRAPSSHRYNYQNFFSNEPQYQTERPSYISSYYNPTASTSTIAPAPETTTYAPVQEETTTTTGNYFFDFAVNF
jgi:hypothetical protein